MNPGLAVLVLVLAPVLAVSTAAQESPLQQRAAALIPTTATASAAAGSAQIEPLPPITAVLKPVINDPLLRSAGSWGQHYPDQWGLFHIGLVHADPEPRGVLPRPLEPITVALIDSGVDYSHPDLPVSHLWQNPNEQANGRDDDGNGLIDDLIGWNFVSGNNSPWDDHGHGTHIAGVIAAGRDNGIGIAGIAPNARLMVLKVVDASGHASGSHIAQAIRYAVSQGAQLIHLSLGGQPPGASELDALNHALDGEVLVVVAAGNQARGDVKPGYGQLEQVFVVGAVTPDDKRALFSGWGPNLDLLAPGVDILSLRAKGSDFLRRNGVAGYLPGSAIVQQHYYRATGTSFAAPYVTGLAALILGRDPWLEPQQVQRLLLQSARDLEPAGVDQNHGYGVLDAQAALNAFPDRFIDARLLRAELNTRQQLVIHGTVDADQFFQARIDYALGADPDSDYPDSEHPNRWKPLLPQPITQPLRNQPLLSLDPNLLPKGRLITLRLITEHRDGTRRESRMQLQLPGGAR